ncbi:hypothetical protein HU200_019874 [Digitaria exilis]|uniref:Uncharacterized protein n=1 Tax=Digitaria exilis TaxID=1010633 RepID=A0A835KEZ0_9POAL|nr:hypothetical protein HU200_019874 [Digitaria exilis]
MGCLCSKGAKDDNATSGHRTPSRRDDSTVAASAKTSVVTNDGSNAKFKENTFNSSTFRFIWWSKVVALDARISSGNNTDLKDVAGWPAWLINVAPKAVEGWLPRRADSFEKLGKIGQGTYSIVYKARDIEPPELLLGATEYGVCCGYVEYRVHCGRIVCWQTYHARRTENQKFVEQLPQLFKVITKPLACDPSSLPKLPPSKEYDVRLRQEEARRQRDAALSGGAESVRPENGNHVTSRAIDIAALVKARHSPTLPAFVTLQQQPTHTTSKSTCEKFNKEDSVPGFRVEPRALPTSVQVPECGSTWNNMGGYTHHHAVPGRVCSSVRVARKKGSSHSNIPQYDPTDLRNGSEITYHDQPADRPASSHKKDLQELMSAACGDQNRGRKYKRIHYSGPLMPPGGNIEDMLKEHERHIQEAVRKARLGKVSR